MPYTTVADLIKVLQTFDPNTPILGFSVSEDYMEMFSSISLLGVNGEIIELKTGVEVGPKIDKEWFLPYKNV